VVSGGHLVALSNPTELVERLLKWSGLRARLAG
jgi:hypothetical protein